MARPRKSSQLRMSAHGNRFLPPIVGLLFFRGIVPCLFLAQAIIFYMLLSSYSLTDPAWNSIGATATKNGVQNSVGSWGAIIADIMINLFGLASYAMVLLSTLWAGLWLGTSLPLENLGFRVRLGRLLLVLVCTLSSMMLIATVTSTLSNNPAHAGWIGSAIDQSLRDLLVAPWSTVAFYGAGFLGLILFFCAARLPMAEYIWGIRLFGDIILWICKAVLSTLRRGGESSMKQLRRQPREYTQRLSGQSFQSPEQQPKQAKTTAPDVAHANIDRDDTRKVIAPNDGKSSDNETLDDTALAWFPRTFSTSASNTDGGDTSDQTAVESQTAHQQRQAPSLEPISPQLRQEPTLEASAFAFEAQQTPSTETMASLSLEDKINTESDSTKDAIPPVHDVAPIHKTPAAENVAASSRVKSRKITGKGEFQLPSMDLLSAPLPHIKDTTSTDEELQANARRLEEVLSDFNIKGEIQQIRPGPVVTMYELEPAPGIKTTRIINLSEDIARNMRALSVRIATIPGHSALGIELPNTKRTMVNMKEILSGRGYQHSNAKLPMILGKKIDGVPLVVDLATMPHLLIAGTTGSGKSVGLNVMLLSILYRLTPDQCRIIMIDPKMLEFSVYDGIPHLLTPVVTEPKQAVVALKWTVREMENRYRLMAKVNVRNIDGYNQRVAEAQKRGEPIVRKVHAGYDTETGEAIYDTEELPCELFPLIVVVVDEMADLMIVAGKEIEASIQRLAQMARAAGIHLIMATQRPSVDVITGTIKANFPTRISYRVTSKIDSRTIIGEMGAEQLLGKGDLLLMQAAGNITRVHAPFVEDAEVEKICDWLRQQRPANYLEEVTDENAINQELGDVSAVMFDADSVDTDASLYDKAVAIVAHHQKASTSFIQRQLRIGYNRAADLIDEMENQGVISSANHSGKREVLIKSFEE